MSVPRLLPSIPTPIKVTTSLTDVTKVHAINTKPNIKGTIDSKDAHTQHQTITGDHLRQAADRFNSVPSALRTRARGGASPALSISPHRATKQTKKTAATKLGSTPASAIPGPTSASLTPTSANASPNRVLTAQELQNLQKVKDELEEAITVISPIPTSTKTTNIVASKPIVTSQPTSQNTSPFGKQAGNTNVVVSPNTSATIHTSSTSTDTSHQQISPSVHYTAIDAQVTIFDDKGVVRHPIDD